jgi:hypothetical protein
MIATATPLKSRVEAGPPAGFNGESTPDAAQKPRRRGWPAGRPRLAQRHNLKTLKRAVKTLGARTLDRRTGVGKALASWRADLLADLGGEGAVSTQQRAVIDLAVRTKLLLDSIDAWLLVQPSLINKRKRALIPVVRERTQLADALARYLSALGLERKMKQVPSLHDYLASRVPSEPRSKDVSAP